MGKEIVIILSHADTEEKIETLKECVASIKKQGYDIILSSHINELGHVQDYVDYFIYDKENPLIRYTEYKEMHTSIHVYANFPECSHYYPIEFNHGYAVLKLIKNACSLAILNDYSIAHIVNYDYTINEHRVLKEHEAFLEESDIVSYNWINNGAEHDKHISSGFFSIKIKPFLNIISPFNSKSEYCENGSPIFEDFLYSIAIKNNLRIKQIPVSDILEKNKISTTSVNGLDKHVITTDENEVLFLFLSKDSDGVYYLFFNYYRSVELNIKVGNITHDLKLEGHHLIKLNNGFIDNGVSIEIPEFKIKRYFTANTISTECIIKNKNIILDIN